MATFLSPGVYVTEKDASAIAPAIANNVAFFAGTFNAGPVGLPYVITNKIELERVFGTPDDKNYNEFFQAWKFLDYADQLIITRSFDEAPSIFDPNYSPSVSADPEEIGTYTNYVHGSSSSASFNMKLGRGKNFKLPEFGINDYLSLETRAPNQAPQDALVQVADMSVISAGSECEIAVQVNFLRNGSISVSNPVEGKVFLHSKGYYNGETQAFQRGPIGTLASPIKPLPIAVDDGNIDKANAGSCINPNRLNYKYNLIKNDEEWSYLYTQDTNPLRSRWMPEASIQNEKFQAKLKFFSRTPTENQIQVCIANSDDFKYELDANGNQYNRAACFVEQIYDRVHYTYLTDLFQYTPNEDQVALVFKQNDQIETFIVSFDPLSVDGNGRSNYVENVINEQSKLLYVLENRNVNDLPASYLICDRFGREEDTNNPGGWIYNGTETAPLIVQGGKTPTVTIGGLKEAYSSVEDKEKYEIDVVIANEKAPEIAVDLADKRKDCIAYVGAQYSDVVGKKALEATNNIVRYITEEVHGKRVAASLGAKLPRTMFAAFFGNYFRIYDPYNKKFRYINVAGDMAGIRCSITTSNASWWVSAGMRRGKIKGIDSMAFTPSLPMRDQMYKNGINPLVTFPGTGHLVWGNKTLQSYASAFDRINVRSMFNTIERSMAKAARSQVFEFNDPYTRNAMLSMFNPYLAGIKAARGLIDYLVICDETNNNPDVLTDPQELRVDIYVQPNYAAEFIQLNFTNVGTRSFVEVIGA